MSLPGRLRQMRLAWGLSQDALVARMDGIITKQALSQYETGKAQPRLGTLRELARALNVASADLLEEPSFSVEFVAFRRKSGMSKGVEEAIQSRISLELEKRVRLQNTIKPRTKSGFPLQAFPVNSFEDTESTALQLRELMGLGCAPISNVTDTLESRGVHIFALDTSDKFEGVSAVAKKGGQIVAGGIVTRSGVCGERQRLTACHEAGHLFLKVSPSLDEEKVAFRFAGAFLIPEKALRVEVGNNRKSLLIDELLTLKKRYGISIAALLTRMRDLEIITPSYYKVCFISLSKRGWRKVEPEPLKPERSLWFRQNVLRARAQGFLTNKEAAELLGEPYQMSLLEDFPIPDTNGQLSLDLGTGPHQ